MFEALEHLLEAKGPDAKAVVWAHNSHIGDARFTDMGMTPSIIAALPETYPFGE